MVISLIACVPREEEFSEHLVFSHAFYFLSYMHVAEAYIGGISAVAQRELPKIFFIFTEVNS